MAKFILSPEVEEELTAIAEYIAEDDPDTADRFIEAAYETFARLGRLPGMRRARRFRASRLKNLRSFPKEQTMQTVEDIIKQACRLSPQDRQRLVEEVEASLVKDVIKRRPARKDSWATEMRSVLSEFRKGAKGYSAEAIDQIVDEAVAAVRSGKRPRKGKA